MEIEKLLNSDVIPAEGGGFEDVLHDARRRLEAKLQRIRRPKAAVGILASPLGQLLVAISAKGILLIHFMDVLDNTASIISRLKLQFDVVEDDAAVRPVGEEIRRYLAGDEKALTMSVDLSLVARHSFQKRVLEKLCGVPRGATVSYRALGAMAGNPAAARAVGNAVHENPVAIYVPCHRVIASDLGLGGYAGGSARKLKLLRSEGFAIDDARPRVSGPVVWGHRGTRIYCRTTCRTTARVDPARVLFFAGPAQASKAGMRACKICRPA